MGLAWAFDGADLKQLPAIWLTILWQSSLGVGVFILALCAALIFFRDPLKQALRGAAPHVGPVQAGWAILHVVTAAGFAFGMVSVLARPELAAMTGVAGLVALMALALVSVAALTRSLLGEALVPLFREAALPLLASLALGAVAALATLLIFPYWPRLAGPTLHLTSWMLQACCGDVTVYPEHQVIQLGDFPVFVDRTCSGIEGMALIATFMTGYLIRFRAEHRFPHALILLPVGLMVSFIANAMRLALLIVIGAYVNPELAKGAFHSMAGWIFFCALTIGLVAVARRVPWVQDRQNAPALRSGDNPTAAYLLPFLVWLALSLLASAFQTDLTQGANPVYGGQVILCAGLLWHFRGRYDLPPLREWWGHGSLLQRLSPWLIGVGLFVIWVALAPATTAEERAMPGILAQWSPSVVLLWILFRLVGTAIVVPVIEELAFRGFLQRRAISADFTTVAQGRLTPAAVAISAVVFGLLHASWFAGILAGVAFSVATAVRGRLSDAIIAHAVTNALLSLMVLSLGRWDLW
ncbi:exosortase E/protease, VPEID-CTERM system [Pseudooceanicola sp. C21-150M6]|uniref:exosortase E/protease, VPEID-CTERM system n=1 Tax=Pseudooceanicola sp. C21-150M6 TaxID=3434355 RepID=UPI003D7F9ED2